MYVKYNCICYDWECFDIAWWLLSAVHGACLVSYFTNFSRSSCHYFMINFHADLWSLLLPRVECCPLRFLMQWTWRKKGMSLVISAANLFPEHGSSVTSWHTVAYIHTIALFVIVASTIRLAWQGTWLSIRARCRISVLFVRGHSDIKIHWLAI